MSRMKSVLVRLIVFVCKDKDYFLNSQTLMKTFFLCYIKNTFKYLVVSLIMRNFVATNDFNRTR